MRITIKDQSNPNTLADILYRHINNNSRFACDVTTNNRTIVKVIDVRLFNNRLNSDNWNELHNVVSNILDHFDIEATVSIKNHSTGEK